MPFEDLEEQKHLSRKKMVFHFCFDNNVNGMKEKMNN